MSGGGQHTGEQQQTGGELELRVIIYIQCHQHSYLVVQLEHPVVDGDLVKLEEAAGGLGDDVQNVRHDSCQLRDII